MQACDSIDVLSLTPNIYYVFLTVFYDVDSRLPLKVPGLIRYAPLLCRVEAQTVFCSLKESVAPQTLQTLRSLPQSITWRPLELRLEQPHAQSIVQEVCAALGGTPLAQAVAKLTLYNWKVEAPIAALRASFPSVLHFELRYCHPNVASLFSEAIAVWPMLRSVSLRQYLMHQLEAAQQHLEAAVGTAAELKAGLPLEMVLCVYNLHVVELERLDALVAALQSAGGGRVAVCQRDEIQH